MPQSLEAFFGKYSDFQSFLVLIRRSLFPAVTLKGENAKATWAPKEILPDDNFGTKLALKQILLGHDAKEGDYHVVEANTQKQKIPIAVLKLGETQVSLPNLEFPLAVEFTLIKGSGPVHLVGLQYPEALYPEGRPQGVGYI